MRSLLESDTPAASEVTSQAWCFDVSSGDPLGDGSIGTTRESPAKRGACRTTSANVPKCALGSFMGEGRGVGTFRGNSLCWGEGNFSPLLNDISFAPLSAATAEPFLKIIAVEQSLNDPFRTLYI